MVTAVRGEPSTWNSEGVQTNPTTSTVLADTGQLAVGSYLLTVAYSATVASVPDLQWRNAANSGNNEVQRFHLAATSPIALTMHVRVNAANERFRIILSANITGDASASIWCQPTN